MEINRTDRTSATNVRRLKPAGSQDSSFSVAASDAPRAQSVASPGPIGAVDNILVLQGLDDSTSGRSRGLAQGEKLLDMLDEVRDGLLSGGIPRGTLTRLATAVSHRHETFADPKLQGVLDEIELRARVELAKMEQSDRLAS